jgi:hypothetical protein
MMLMMMIFSSTSSSSFDSLPHPYRLHLLYLPV